MSRIKDGGPAFARAGSEVNYDEEGMSLRDYFAGQVLAVIATKPGAMARSQHGYNAYLAYRQADEMITQRDMVDGKATGTPAASE